MTRSMQCTNNAGEQMSDEECEEVMDRMGIPRTRQCNSFPCEITLYAVGEWQSCNCESGVSARDVRCVYASNPEEAINEDFCRSLGVERPQDLQLCKCESTARRALLQAVDQCEGITCSGEI